VRFARASSWAGPRLLRGRARRAPVGGSVTRSRPGAIVGAGRRGNGRGTRTQKKHEWKQRAPRREGDSARGERARSCVGNKRAQGETRRRCHCSKLKNKKLATQIPPPPMTTATGTPSAQAVRSRCTEAKDPAQGSMHGTNGRVVGWEARAPHLKFHEAVFAPRLEEKSAPRRFYAGFMPWRRFAPSVSTDAR
jgi:hypothetical protein